jgi:hypothetical protein
LKIYARKMCIKAGAFVQPPPPPEERRRRSLYEEPMDEEMEEEEEEMDECPGFRQDISTIRL